MITAQLQSFGGQQLPFQSLTEDINSLSYMVDQVSSAVDILQTVNEMRSRRCARCADTSSATAPPSPGPGSGSVPGGGRLERLEPRLVDGAPSGSGAGNS